mmetsp:Transcript_6099/g.18076  ORF Transcript_6099/g.18076 Transcript_6099/m.18076 type:complete len:561 (+) Transcript_6099:872-2554(+)
MDLLLRQLGRLLALCQQASLALRRLCRPPRLQRGLLPAHRRVERVLFRERLRRLSQVLPGLDSVICPPLDLLFRSPPNLLLRPPPYLVLRLPPDLLLRPPPELLLFLPPRLLLPPQARPLFRLPRFLFRAPLHLCLHSPLHLLLDAQNRAGGLGLFVLVFVGLHVACSVPLLHGKAAFSLGLWWLVLGHLLNQSHDRLHCRPLVLLELSVPRSMLLLLAFPKKLGRHVMHITERLGVDMEVDGVRVQRFILTRYAPWDPSTKLATIDFLGLGLHKVTNLVLASPSRCAGLVAGRIQADWLHHRVGLLHLRDVGLRRSRREVAEAALPALPALRRPAVSLISGSRNELLPSHTVAQQVEAGRAAQLWWVFDLARGRAILQHQLRCPDALARRVESHGRILKLLHLMLHLQRCLPSSVWLLGQVLAGSLVSLRLHLPEHLNWDVVEVPVPIRRELQDNAVRAWLLAQACDNARQPCDQGVAALCIGDLHHVAGLVRLLEMRLDQLNTCACCLALLGQAAPPESEVAAIPAVRVATGTELDVAAGVEAVALNPAVWVPLDRGL